MAELIVQVAQCVDDEGGVGDGGAAVIELIGETLELAAVLGDAHVTLEQAMKFLLGVHSALEAVVKELAEDGVPDGEGGGVGAIDIIPYLLGHGVVQPRDDASIDLKPFGIVDHGRCINRAINVIEEAEFLDGELEEGTPLPEVAFVRVEDNRDVAADVEHHQGGGGRWSGISEWVGSGGSRRTRHGWEMRKQRLGSRLS